jgi:lysophospholipase L1-like esterase
MALSRRTRALVLFAMVVAAVATPCLIAEAVLRLVGPPPDTPGLFMMTTSGIDYIGRPGARGLVSGAEVAFNRFGLRDREYAAQKRSGTIRILILGDSMTFGVGVPEPRTYPRVAETLLNHTPDRHAAVEVLNFGVPGYNTFQELTEFEELGAALRPDIVVVGFLYNDLEISSGQRRHLDERRVASQKRQPASGAHLLRTGLSGASSNRSMTARVNAALDVAKRHSVFLAWLSPRLAVLLRPLGVRGVGLLGEVNGQFVDSNPEWRRVQSELLTLKRLCDEQNIRLALMIIPAMTKFEEGAYPIKPYHEAVSRFCTASSIASLDLLPSFWGMDGTKMWISATDGHPNARAHQIMAEALATFLRPIVLETARRQNTGAHP